MYQKRPVLEHRPEIGNVTRSAGTGKYKRGLEAKSEEEFIAGSDTY